MKVQIQVLAVFDGVVELGRTAWLGMHKGKLVPHENLSVETAYPDVTVEQLQWVQSEAERTGMFRVLQVLHLLD